ncbi:exosortase C-terminal domain/associated protein EpsI [Desulfosediminicola flagellatus]|uniref:exosortase C-terminal domain/associated protein EpsI n=1 Tax=Desulfosediminicola flagellatus TaxID=2569541 RepID=UPI0010ACED70|nr:exosortase C-terminal domain/associated protein EpsI [Desulfosediminicola flagellatus]
MISKARVLIVLVLFVVTWYVMDVTGEVKPVPIKKTLSKFPHSVGEYSLSNSFQSSSEVVELLGVEDYIQYNYIHPDGRRINLYVGYYEAVGMGAGYHSPRNCIPGGGWGIDNVIPRTLDVNSRSNEKSNISEMVIRRGNELQVVYYWYQNRGRVIGSEYWEKIYQVMDALLSGRRDGAFVRVMASVPGNDLSTTRLELEDFSEKVMETLKDYLPGAQI